MAAFYYIYIYICMIITGVLTRTYRTRINYECVANNIKTVALYTYERTAKLLYFFKKKFFHIILRIVFAYFSTVFVLQYDRRNPARRKIYKEM